MDKTYKGRQKIIYNLIYILIIFSLVYTISLGIGLNLDFKIQLPIIGIMSLIVKFFLFNPLVLYIALFIFFIIAIIVQRYYYPILSNMGERIYLLFNNILENLQGKENISPDNLILFWTLIIILISIFTAFIIFKLKNIYLLLPIYILPFLYYWYNFYDEAYFMIALFLLCFLILRGLNNYYIRDIDYIQNQWFKTVTIYSMLVILLALILPKSYNYIEWPWLQEKVYTYFPFVEELRSYDSNSRKSGIASMFDFSLTGYQGGNAKLGGPIRISNQKIMTIKSDEPIYLRGKVKHIYTGYSWESYAGGFKEYKANERLSGLLNYDRRNYFEEKYITIIHENYASTTIFSPYLPDSVNLPKYASLLINEDNILIFPKGVYRNESYTVRIQKPYPYGILLSKNINNSKDDIKNIDIYLQVPEDKISDEIKYLVRTIVKDKKDDFEKAIAIEKYLRDNYKYTYDVKEVPENVEFIYHFLFNEKKGYCTYFSTAMAIMLRLEGIPTRYVEGYLVTEEIEPGLYEVMDRNAHSWVEAFIEPVGWMTFEPTPAYPIQSRMDNLQSVQKNESRIPNNIELPIRERTEIIDEVVYEEVIDKEYETITENNNIDNIHFINISNERKKLGFNLIKILMLIIPIRFLMGFIYYKYKDIKYKTLTNNEKIIYLYKQILRLIEIFGYPQNYGETHYEYANRIANKFYYEKEKNLRDITHIFVQSKYGNYLTSNEDVNLLEKYNKTLNKHLKKYLGFRKYFYIKYIKMDIIKG